MTVVARLVSPAALLLLLAMARSEASPLSFADEQVSAHAVVFSMNGQQNLSVTLNGFDIAPQPKPSHQTAKRVVHLQGSQLVTSGQAIEVGDLPPVLIQRLDHVWQVAVGSEVDVNSFQVNAEVLIQSAGSADEVQAMVQKIETYRQSVQFDAKRNATIIEGGLLVQLRTAAIESAGEYRLNIVLTSETY